MNRRGWGTVGRSHEGRNITEGEVWIASAIGLVLAVLLMGLGDWIARVIAG